jgi:hypothetical protein
VIVAHVGGVPVEEVLPALAGTGSGLLVARAWLAVRLRRRRRPEGRRCTTATPQRQWRETMAQDTHTGDALIDQAEEAATGGREERAANLFDIRRIIGGLFLLYGVVLFVLGLGASDADIKRAAGINVNLWVGVSLLATAACFITWAMLRPLGRELQEDEPARQDDDYERQRFTRDPAASPAGRSASREAARR